MYYVDRSRFVEINITQLIQFTATDKVINSIQLTVECFRDEK